MKKNILFLMLILLASCGPQKIKLSELHTLEPIKLFETSTDFLNQRAMGTELGVLITDKSDQHITTKGVFDLKTGEVNNKGLSAWAIEYKDERYFNLGYSSDLNHWGSYAKFDIVGTFCVIIIDDDSPHILQSKSQGYYGGGLVGGLASALVAESSKWGKNWKDKEGNKKKLLFIDTEKVKPQAMNRNASAHGNYLTKKELEKILEITETTLEEDIKDIHFEKIIELIKIANEI